MTELRFEVPPALVEEIAERAAALVLERLAVPAASSPYMTVSEAAEYLRCSRQRVYDLLSSGRLSRLKDGSRVLVSRDEIDAHLSGRAAPLRPPLSQSRITTRKAA